MKQQPLVMTADWEDMVFSGRERAYGAYALRQAYPKHLAFALLTVSLAVILSVMSKLYWDQLFPPKPVTQAILVDMSTMIPPPITEPEIEPFTPPPPPPPPAPSMVKTLAANIPLPTADDELEDEEATIETIDSLKAATNVGLRTQDGVDEAENPFASGEDGFGEPPEVIVNQEPGAGVWIDVDEEPKPVNIHEIKKMIGYPPMAVDIGLEGTAVARVLVDKRGRYVRHIWVNSPNGIFVEAIVPHLSKLYFTPAIQAKRPIMFWVNIPFTFSLVND